jgi:methanogenic corrinoid protein MtbC1
VTTPDPFHASIIESSARALAAHAAELLLARHPSASAFGTPAFRRWQDHLGGRLLELAGAMRAGEPDLFASGLRWASIAFNARGLSGDELLAALDAMGEALEEGLPNAGPRAADPYLAVARRALEAPARQPPPAVAGPYGELASQYLLAVLEGDRRRAVALIDEAVDRGLNPRDALVHVAIPVSCEIGRMWHLGEVTVGEEHFVTATSSLLFGAMRQRMSRAEPNGRCVMIASVPGNRHELAGRVAGLLLEAAGWRVVDVGTEMPSEDIVRSAADFGADLLVLGVMLTTQIETTAATLNALRDDERTRGTPVIVGGHVFDQAPQLWKRIGADAHARTVGEIVELAEAVWKHRQNGGRDE